MEIGSEDRQAERRGDEMLTAAEENFRGIMHALLEMRRRLESGDDTVSEPEIRRRLSGVRKAIQAVFDERKRLDDIRKAQAGRASDTALDLQLADHEVRSRLARLRAALHRDTLPPNS